MQLIRLMLISLIAFFVAISVVAEDVVKPDPREALEAAIPEGIRLLDAKEYRVFVESFVPPADLTTLTEETTLEEFAAKFGAQKAPRLFEVLKEIKDAKPNLDETGTKATFPLKERIAGRRSITFVKVEKYWYISN